MAINRTTVTVTASGGAGSSTGSGITERIVHGKIVGIYLDYSAGTAATTDTTIEEAHNSPAIPIVTETNYNTDGWIFPAHSTVDSAGTAVTDGTQDIFVADYVSVTLAGANNGDSVTVTVVWNDLSIGRR